MGKKAHLGASFTLKITLFYLEKGTFWMLEFGGSKRRRSLIPPPLIWLCPFRGNEKGSRGQLTGSAVAIKKKKILSYHSIAKKSALVTDKTKDCFQDSLDRV